MKQGGEMPTGYGQIQHLSQEEMTRLFHELGQGGGKRVRDQLIRGNMRLVLSMVRPYTRAYSQHISYDDLVQEGALGLIKAVDRFDVTRGIRFSTYATWWVKQALNEAVTAKKRMIRLPSHAHRLLKRLIDARETYRETFGCDPSYEELSALTGASADVIRGTLQSGLPTASIQESKDPQSESNNRPQNGVLSVIPDTAPSPFDLVLGSEVMAAVSAALDSLSARENVIIRLRLGLVGDAGDSARFPITQAEADGLAQGIPLS